MKHVHVEDEDIQFDRYEIVVSGSGGTVWINGNDGLCWATIQQEIRY